MSNSSSQTHDYFSEREEYRFSFLRNCGFEKAELTPVGEDCAFRRYFRLKKDLKSVILMEAVPDDNEMASPGHKIGDYIRIGMGLRALGLNTPEIYEADPDSGYLLLEDFGDTSFKDVISRGALQHHYIYSLAVDVLSEMRKVTGEIDFELPNYYESHVHEGKRRVVDWYMPFIRKEQNSDSLVEDYNKIWQEIEAKLPACPNGFLHIDYHVENLMYLQKRHGLMRCGLLDFQGAMMGPQPYDLANLLEDVRIDVSHEMREEMLLQFCKKMSADEKECFLSWYRVLATQFHCRVLGQFIKLALVVGKERYLEHIPRVCHYLQSGLDHEILAPLKSWFLEYQIDFSVSFLDLSDSSKLIREDAF
jgi:aminoglycoside/choline kinase family phosphotransferase